MGNSSSTLAFPLLLEDSSTGCWLPCTSQLSTHGNQSEYNGVSYLSINRQARGHDVRGTQHGQDGGAMQSGGNPPRRGSRTNSQWSQRQAKSRASEAE